MPLVSRPHLLLVILDRDDEEHEQGDALNPCQEEEIVVQMAVVDVTWWNGNERDSQKESKELLRLQVVSLFCFADSFIKSAIKTWWEK